VWLKEDQEETCNKKKGSNGSRANERNLEKEKGGIVGEEVSDQESRSAGLGRENRGRRGIKRKGRRRYPR